MTQVWGLLTFRGQEMESAWSKQLVSKIVGALSPVNHRRLHQGCGVNKKWCHPNNVTVKQKHCSHAVKILTIGVRPDFLLREFFARARYNCVHASVSQSKWSS